MMNKRDSFIYKKFLVEMKQNKEYRDLYELVDSFIERYYQSTESPNYDLEDFIQECFLALEDNRTIEEVENQIFSKSEYLKELGTHDDLVLPKDTIKGTIEDVELKEFIKSKSKRLNKTEREIYDLYYNKQYSIKEISEELNMDYSKIQYALHSIRSKINITREERDNGEELYTPYQKEMIKLGKIYEKDNNLHNLSYCLRRFLKTDYSNLALEFGLFDYDDLTKFYEWAKTEFAKNVKLNDYALSFMHDYAKFKELKEYVKRNKSKLESARADIILKGFQR